jgi:hypothetical protein
LSNPRERQREADAEKYKHDLTGMQAAMEMLREQLKSKEKAKPFAFTAPAKPKGGLYKLNAVDP